MSRLSGAEPALEALESGKAPKHSPAFTGTPTAPTASGGTNTTQIATTEFVQAALATLGITIIEGDPGGAALTNGVALEVWRYTLAEGEVIGATIAITGGRLNVATTERSFGRIAISASRSVGGVAERTAGGGAEEVGTIAGGTISSDVDGNDVVVFVTYTTDGTLFYKLRVELDSVDVPQA